MRYFLDYFGNLFEGIYWASFYPVVLVTLYFKIIPYPTNQRNAEFRNLLLDFSVPAFSSSSSIMLNYLEFLMPGTLDFWLVSLKVEDFDRFERLCVCVCVCDWIPCFVVCGFLWIHC